MWVLARHIEIQMASNIKILSNTYTLLVSNDVYPHYKYPNGFKKNMILNQH